MNPNRPTKNTCPLSFTQLVLRFPTQEAARKFIEEKRWNGKPVCPHCGCSEKQGEVSRVNKAKGTKVGGYYQCSKCRKVYTVRTGTIMERSHIALNKWLFGIYLTLVNRHGISSMQLAKTIGVGQHAAWFMLQRIREACKLKTDAALLQGIVEVDEVYIGGKESLKHECKKKKLGRGTIGKTPVVGMKERKGKVHAFVVKAADKTTVHALLNRNVAAGSTLHTDEAAIYNGLDAFMRQQVNHGQKEFSRDGVTTNSIESVWACVRRAIIGTWHGVEEKHMQRYIDECCFRLNDGSVEYHIDERIDSLLGGMFASDHLTYAELIEEEWLAA